MNDRENEIFVELIHLCDSFQQDSKEEQERKLLNEEMALTGTTLICAISRIIGLANFVLEREPDTSKPPYSNDRGINKACAILKEDMVSLLSKKVKIKLEDKASD